MKISKITTWKEAKWKLISELVSAKIQIFIITSLFLIFGLIGATEWIVVTSIVLTGRVYRAYTEQHNDNTELNIG